MTLEGFFTQIEMEEGLTALSRVRELVEAMGEEGDLAGKSVAEAARRWAAVGNAIAATIDADCIELFLQLDGFLFISKWLTAAEAYSRDGSDDSVEESLSAILRAIENLKIDRGKSLSSGIMSSVENLLRHENSLVQESARKLHERWNPSPNPNLSDSNVEAEEALENHGIVNNDEEVKSSNEEEIAANCENDAMGSTRGSNPGAESSCDEKSVNRSTDSEETDGLKGNFGCEMDYGIVDALEVARQVAQEVERQVVDYKEPSCSSSSEKILKTGFRLPSSPESVAKQLEFEPETEDGDNSHTESQIQEDGNESQSQKPVCFLDLNEEIVLDSPDRSPEPVQFTGSNRKESGLEIDLNMSLDLNLNASPARNFDLNDRPFPFQQETQDSVPVPVFSLFGAKLPVSGTLKAPQISKSHHETGFSRVLGVSYPSPVFGYNSQMPLPLPLPLPSYVAPVPMPYQQPFLTAVPQFPLNGIVAPRPPLDLNAGFGFDGAIRQLLGPRPMEEQYGSSSQASSSGLSGKRKETESGLDSYTWHYKHPRPPWR